MAVLESLIGYNLQTFFVFMAVFLYMFNYLKKSEWKGLPPGPVALPLLGSLPFLGPDIREPLKHMGKRYGDVFTIYIGYERCVVLNSYDAIKDAFVKHGNSFSERPQIYFITDLTKGLGVLSASGQRWREQRRFTHNVLRDLGLGRTTLEGNILEETRCLNQYFADNVDKPFDAKYILSCCVSNVICAIVFGRRFDYADPEFQMYMKIISDSINIVANNSALSVFPWLRYLPGDPFKGKLMLEYREYMDKVFKKFIDDHREELKTKPDPTDFIGAYVKQIDKEKEENKESTFFDYQLTRILGDLFSAGTETTATTLLWALVYMIRDPGIQEDLYNEIIETIGPDKTPTYQDREKMPFAEACVIEIQRLGDVTPFGVPHATNDDVEFRGYVIPKGTMILPSCYSVHMDDAVYPDPRKFDPRRYIDDTGKLVRKEQFIPFSVGRRMCLGEGLARMELFLFVVSIFQKYKVTCPVGQKLPETVGIVGMTHAPLPFQICLSRR